MSDIFNSNKRSEIMRKVRSNNNKSTELRLIKLFKKLEVKGWKRKYPVKGKPDFVFVKRRIAIFVDGCFWHGHHCRNIEPTNNAEYWMNKRKKNQERDRYITELFESRGWIVIRIWECELTKKNESFAINKLELLLTKKEDK